MSQLYVVQPYSEIYRSENGLKQTIILKYVIGTATIYSCSDTNAIGDCHQPLMLKSGYMFKRSIRIFIYTSFVTKALKYEALKSEY